MMGAANQDIMHRKFVPIYNDQKFKIAISPCERGPLRLVALSAFGMDFWVSQASSLHASSAAWRASFSPIFQVEVRQDRSWSLADSDFPHNFIG
jgi:hypothetical protein